jgi:hypothetical protein
MLLARQKSPRMWTKQICSRQLSTHVITALIPKAGKPVVLARTNLIKTMRSVIREYDISAINTIHDKAPREEVGRDTTARFRMQFQAAAYATLEILSGNEVDRVYCDYHDDFVVRRKAQYLWVYRVSLLSSQNKRKS